MNYYAFNERKASRNQSYPLLTLDTVDFPDVLVTEAEATAATMKQYVAAEQRRALELVEEADAVWKWAR